MAYVAGVSLRTASKFVAFKSTAKSCFSPPLLLIALRIDRDPTEIESDASKLEKRRVRSTRIEDMDKTDRYRYVEIDRRETAERERESMRFLIWLRSFESFEEDDALCL